MNRATHFLLKNLNLHDAVDRLPSRQVSSLTATGSAGKVATQTSIITRQTF